MSTILDRIIAQKHIDIERAMAICSQTELEAIAADQPIPRDFYAALHGHTDMRLIAEVKKASPSKGVIREDFDPVAIATAYAENGAAAISVLTDETFFQGNLQYLRDIRAAVDIPLLRKEFIIDRYQVIEARAAGADAILLIAECLTAEELNDLYQYSRELGMHALIELYEPSNLSKVLDTGCPIVGINNRDLRTFEVDLDHTIRLKQNIPHDRVVVSESGIFTNDHVKYLLNQDVDAILVGESLMRQADIGAAVRKLLGKE
jgi:indole-3-glycerol phosphate synthase